ncbi:MAG TPA: GIY-YIG nuclease family protein [Caulobacteraceae bacterium]
MAFFTYILASGRNGTLYSGSTDDLVKRVWQHKSSALRVSQPSMARTSSYGLRCMNRGPTRLRVSAGSRNGIGFGNSS